MQAPAPRVKNIVILLVRRLGRVSSRRCGYKGEHRAEGIVRRCPPALGLFLAGPPIQNGTGPAAACDAAALIPDSKSWGGSWLSTLPGTAGANTNGAAWT